MVIYLFGIIYGLKEVVCLGEKKARNCPVVQKVVVCSGVCKVVSETGKSELCSRYLRALDLALNC